MNKWKNYLQITKPMIMFCIVLILVILMGCSKEDKNKFSLNVNKNDSFQKTLIDGNDEKKYIEEVKKENYFNGNDEKKYIGNDEKNEKNDLIEEDIRNTYYGKYNLHGQDVLGTFEVTRNSIIFIPDDGNSKEVIHFYGIKNIDRFDHPNGKVDLVFQYDGNEKLIKNVSDEMFTNILLYTTK